MRRPGRPLSSTKEANLIRQRKCVESTKWGAHQIPRPERGRVPSVRMARATTKAARDELFGVPVGRPTSFTFSSTSQQRWFKTLERAHGSSESQRKAETHPCCHIRECVCAFVRLWTARESHERPILYVGDLLRHSTALYVERIMCFDRRFS